MIPEITAIAISLGSYHFDYHGQNQFNPGIHVEAENVRAGLYYNSLRRTTAYVGYSLPIARTEIAGVSYKLGVLAALGSGYNSPVFGGLEFVVGQHLVLLAAPAVGSYNSATVGVALRFPLEK